MIDVYSYQENCELIRAALKKLIDNIETIHPPLHTNLLKLISYKNFNQLNPNGLEAILYLVEVKGCEYANDYLFNCETASDSDIDIYRDWHAEYYKEIAEQIAQKIINTPGFVFTTLSGMYGGKSTLARMIIKRVIELDPEYESLTIVPYFMNEPFVSIRGEAGKDGKKNHEVPAIPVHINPTADNHWKKEILKKLATCNNNKLIIHFDEYSFIEDQAAIQEIINYAKSLGVALILPGLDTDFLGRELIGFRAAIGISDDSHQCKSFVRGQANEQPENEHVAYPKPRGTMTTRFVELGEGDDQFTIRDLGFLIKVIEKEITDVRYRPEELTDHLISWLDSKILERMHNPNSVEIANQNELAAEVIANFHAKVAKTKES